MQKESSFISEDRIIIMKWCQNLKPPSKVAKYAHVKDYLRLCTGMNLFLDHDDNCECKRQRKEGLDQKVVQQMGVGSFELQDLANGKLKGFCYICRKEQVLADIIFNSCTATFKIEGDGFEIEEEMKMAKGKNQKLSSMQILKQFMKLGKKVNKFSVIVEATGDFRAVA